MAEKPGGGISQTQIFNLITAAMLALTVATLCSMLIAAARWAGSAQAAEQGASGPTPTLFQVSTATNTPEGPTPGATLTPSPTGPATQGPTATRTPTISPTPTATDTPLTPRATNTPTPTGTSEATNTPTPTEEPEEESGFEYTLRNDITYLPSDAFYSEIGCEWAGIAGLVFDSQGRHQIAVTVRVRSGDFEETSVSGEKSDVYGQSGWEVFLNNEPISGVFTVDIVDSSGTPISESIEVQMVDNCEQAVAFLVFDQQ